MEGCMTQAKPHEGKQVDYIHEKASRLDLVAIRKRVKQKRHDYIKYDFSRKKNDILKTFFDLSQEFDSLTDLYRICVSVPLESLEVESRLYLYSEIHDGLELICDSNKGVYKSPPPCPDYVYLSDEPYEYSQSYLVPIFTKKINMNEYTSDSNIINVIGMFEVYPLSKLTKSDKFFFTKYTNRIGYNLRKRMLAHQNVNHLKFIRNLVSDIEHNVIIPNMYFKHLFNHLKKRIAGLDKLSKELKTFIEDKSLDHLEKTQAILQMNKEIKKTLLGSFKEIERHHKNQSLFLESLFRRDHFEKGRFVLRPRLCKLDEEIITPQLNHFKKRMEIRKITIDRPLDMDNEEIELNVDYGLLSQVYANLFSNALKYTEEITDHTQQPRKAIAYGRKILYNHFGPGRAGIKLNVFSTGHHLSDQESEVIFVNGFMGKNSFDQNSRGHGLAFVKYVVELHGGQTGYEPTVEGNNFFFILPIFTNC